MSLEKFIFYNINTDTEGRAEAAWTGRGWVPVNAVEEQCIVRQDGKAS